MLSSEVVDKISSVVNTWVSFNC